MRLLIAAICFALGMTSPLAAAQGPETAATSSLSQLAREYVTIGGAETMFLEGARYGFRETARANGATFTPTQRQRIDAIVDRHFAAAAEVYISHLTTFYSGHSTSEDLSAALAFYRSPAGQRYVGASIQWTFPLTVYLMTNGAAPLGQIEEAPSPERLTLARQLAERLIAQLHDSERVALEGAPIGLAGVTEYIARSFASELAEDDVRAAIAWTNTDVAARLEGPSAERTLALQTASMLAMRAVDLPALQQEVLEVMTNDESPA